MKLTFIGTGYVGLVSATAFAEMGNDVICVDVDQTKVERLRAGELTIYEPGLEELFIRNIRENRLVFSTNLEEAVSESTILFLTLPTPPKEDGSADLSYVMNVTAQLASMLKNSYKKSKDMIIICISFFLFIITIKCVKNRKINL